MTDRQKTSSRFGVCAVFHSRIHLNLQSFVWRRHVGALPRGTNMAAVKQQKHLSLSFAIETKNDYPRVLIH